MCVILICPPKERPSRAILDACADSNPHGGGIAWRNRKRVHWLKTNSVDEIEDKIGTLSGEIVVHFRIASVGGISDELRHPFPVTAEAALTDHGRARAVLFQNGTWTAWEEALRYAREEGNPTPEGEMSDSRAAAFLCSIYGHSFLKHCGGSRWVYFTASRTATFGLWEKVAGSEIRYSNLYWRRTVATLNRKSTALEREIGDLWDMEHTQTYWDIVGGQR